MSGTPLFPKESTCPGHERDWLSQVRPWSQLCLTREAPGEPQPRGHALEVSLREEVWDVHNDGHGVGKTREGGLQGGDSPSGTGACRVVPAGSRQQTTECQGLHAASPAWTPLSSPCPGDRSSGTPFPRNQPLDQPLLGRGRLDKGKGESPRAPQTRGQGRALWALGDAHAKGLKSCQDPRPVVRMATSFSCYLPT